MLDDIYSARRCKQLGLKLLWISIESPKPLDAAARQESSRISAGEREKLKEDRPRSPVKEKTCGSS